MESESDLTVAPERASPVVLTLTREGVVVPSAVAALVAPALRADVTEFGCGGPRGHTRTRVEEKYFVEAHGGDLLAPVGLADRVASHLRQFGIAVTVEERRTFGPRLRPDARVLREGRPDVLPVLLAAAERPRGCHRPETKPEAIGVIAAWLQLYGAARSIVLAPTRDAAGEVYRGLVLPLAGQVRMDRDLDWTTGTRRVVAGVGKLPLLNPADWDLVIAVDALAATAPSLRPAWRRLGSLKAYGVVPTGRTMTPREQLLAEAAFGPPLVPAAAPAVAAHLTVPPTSPAPAAGGDALARKRTAIWNNGPRNAHLAAVAAAARTGDAVALAELGLGRLADALAVRCESRQRVAILVESPEHARHLLAHLPGWRLVRHESQSRRSGWGGWEPEAPLRDPDGFDRAVLTTLAARRVESLDVDVLVRADGTGSPLRLPGFPATAREPDRTQVLIDLADDFDRAAEEDTRARLRAYRNAGWRITAAPQWATAD